MTRSTNARLAGSMFLLYFVVTIVGMVLSGRATAGEGVAEKLASIARHPALLHANVVLTLLTFVCAVVLAVSLYGITRDQDPDIAVLALSCRVGEGLINALSAAVPLGLLWIATDAAGAGINPVAGNALGALLLKLGTWSGLISATCFAVGSTLYCWLFLRARTIPVPLAKLGVFASILLIVLVPAQLIGLIDGPLTGLMYVPIIVFELTLGVWLLVKGVAMSRAHAEHAGGPA
jgi:Domain of unknown function (DUF4386)